jgi:hypothetical protein
MPTTALFSYGVGILVPLKNPEDAEIEAIALTASTTYPAGQVLYEQTSGVYGLYTGASAAVATTTAITETGTVATYTVANSLVAGQYVTVTGAVPADYNGTFQVATATGSAFTVNGMPSGLVTPATTQGIVRTVQYPTHIMQYQCITDASGNVTFGAGPAGTSEWSQTSKAAPAFRSGYFNCADLTGLDAFARPPRAGHDRRRPLHHERQLI